jgi:hypothetical protein
MPRKLEERGLERPLGAAGPQRILSRSATFGSAVPAGTVCAMCFRGSSLCFGLTDGAVTAVCLPRTFPRFSARSPSRVFPFCRRGCVAPEALALSGHRGGQFPSRLHPGRHLATGPDPRHHFVSFGREPLFQSAPEETVGRRDDDAMRPDPVSRIGLHGRIGRLIQTSRTPAEWLAPKNRAAASAGNVAPRMSASSRRTRHRACGHGRCQMWNRRRVEPDSVKAV